MERRSAVLAGLVLFCVAAAASFPCYGQSVTESQAKRIAAACTSTDYLVQSTIKFFLDGRNEKEAIVELEATAKSIEDYLRRTGPSRAEENRLSEIQARNRLLNCMIEKKLTVANLKREKAPAGQRSAQAASSSPKSVRQQPPRKDPTALAPSNTERTNVGSCKVYHPSGDIKPDTTFRWIGSCPNGLGEGDGYFLREDEAGQSRSIVRLRLVAGRSPEDFTVYRRFPGGSLYKLEYAIGRPSQITFSDLPTWAVPYLTTAKVGSLGPATQRHSAVVAESSAVPKGFQIVDAGSCKLIIWPDSKRQSLSWRGDCVDGLAEGEGVMELATSEFRWAAKLFAKKGVIPAGLNNWMETYSVWNNGVIGIWAPQEKKFIAITRQQVPYWAIGFLDSHPAVAGSAQPQQNQADQEEEARRDREERLAAIERRRREDEEDDRQTERERRELRESRDRELTNAMQSAIQGAAAFRNQQSSENARLQSERQRIERDNDRYRQQRAEDDRRLQQQNQRVQQAALERQQADQQRQRAEEERRRKPRQERVNLPKHTNCIRLEWGRNDPKASDQWYTLHNTCAYPLEVHWCHRPGCQRSTAAAEIPSGGSTRSWLLKSNGVSVTVVAACQKDNGGSTVYYNASENQCWSMVTMQ